MKIRLGLDIGGTTVHGIAVTAAEPHDLVVETTHLTRKGADGVVGGALEMVAALRASLPADAEIISIGLGVPGVVHGGAVTHAVNLGLDGEPLDLAAAVSLGAGGVTTTVENDVKAATLGGLQWLRDQGFDVHDLALLNVGTGIAAGLLLDGRLRHGSRGMAGEIGHLVHDPTGPLCPCGRRGCLELYASGSGLRRQWAGTAAALFDAAESGDAEAIRIRDELTSGIAQAISILVYSVDVACVLVTGGVVSATPALRDAILARLRADENTSLGRLAGIADRVRWLPAGHPAGALGAALLGAGDEGARSWKW
ncbi:ROK family protein [Aeromicrobium sp. NPDC092404]|uniref:ROK family protein n=1 Tax=Aeromicrobium sp. NPDC092404 TaxID=3154976 RepID=UPI00342034B5